MAGPNVCYSVLCHSFSQIYLKHDDYIHWPCGNAILAGRCLDKVFLMFQSRVLELEGEVAQLQSGLRLKEHEVDKIGQVASKLTQERDGVSDIVRQEFADRYRLQLI